MSTTAENVAAETLQPSDKSWADRLFIAGLIIYAFSCTFSIAASQIALGLSFIAFMSLYLNGKAQIRPESFTSPFAFLVLTSILAVFRAELPLRAGTEVKSFLVILVLCLIWWRSTDAKQQKKIISVYLFSATGVAAYSVIHALLYMKTGNHSQGFFSTSITFGECQALAALMLTHQIVTRCKRRRTLLLMLIALVIIIASLLLSFTRGAWLGFITGFVVLFVGYPRRLLPIVIMSAVILSIAAYSSPYLQERIAGFDLSRILATTNKSFDQNFESVAVMSGFHRLYIWQRGFSMLGENSVFGIGAKNMKHHYNLLANDFEREQNIIWSHQHNNFMHMMLSYGFIGIIAFFYFIIRLFRFTLAESGGINFGAIAMLACFFTFGLTEHAWGDEEVIMLAFFLTGLLLNSSQEKAIQA